MAGGLVEEQRKPQRLTQSHAGSCGNQNYHGTHELLFGMLQLPDDVLRQFVELVSLAQLDCDHTVMIPPRTRLEMVAAQS